MSRFTKLQTGAILAPRRPRSYALPIGMFGMAFIAALGPCGCQREATRAQPSSETLSAGTDEALAQVAAIHGAAGPWAVAGYRMGRYALTQLGLGRQSFDLEVTHKSPRAVKYSCIADGAAAATGASLGKLNLNLVEAEASAVATTYLRKSTGQAVTLRPTASFQTRFADFPISEATVRGREAMALADSEVFEVVP